MAAVAAAQLVTNRNISSFAAGSTLESCGLFKEALEGNRRGSAAICPVVRDIFIAIVLDFDESVDIIRSQNPIMWRAIELAASTLFANPVALVLEAERLYKSKESLAAVGNQCPETLRPRSCVCRWR